MLYTTDGENQRDSFNLLGREDNVIATARGTGSSEAWYLYNKDVRGSTSSLIDAGGTVAAAYEYDEFGNTTARIGENFDNELCYTGQVYDKETGLYYYNARFYDPEDGRFLTQDTYRGEKMEPDTLHLYAYCANNPVNYVDPSGHDAIWLNSAKGACRAGHAALLVESGSSWYYFNWLGDGYKGTELRKKLTGCVNKKKKKVKKKINKYRPSSKPYTSSIYITGDFRKSYDYMGDIIAGKSYKKYSLTTTNCAWMAIEVLRKGAIGKKKRKKLWDLQYEKVNRRGATYNRKRLVIPNIVLYSIKRITGGTKKKIEKYY